MSIYFHSGKQLEILLAFNIRLLYFELEGYANTDEKVSFGIPAHAFDRYLKIGR